MTTTQRMHVRLFVFQFLWVTVTAPLWWGVLGDARNTVLLPYYEIMKFGGAIP